MALELQVRIVGFRLQGFADVGFCLEFFCVVSACHELCYKAQGLWQYGGWRASLISERRHTAYPVNREFSRNNNHATYRL